MINITRIIIACLCAQIMHVIASDGTQQNFVRDQSGGDPLYILGHGSQLKPLKVHHLVDYTIHQGHGATKDTIHLQSNNESLIQWQASAMQQGIDTRSGAIHIITIVSPTDRCGKAVALRAAGTATINQKPFGNEALYDIQFETSCAEGPPTKLGIFATEPFKRHGNYYVLMMLRYPPSDANKDGLNRFRTLALQISSGGIFITNQDSFRLGRDQHAATGLDLLANTECKSGVVLNKIPLVGLRYGERGNKTFEEEFFARYPGGELPYDQEQREVLLKRTYTPIAFDAYQLNNRHSDVLRQYVRDPYGFYVQHKNSTPQYSAQRDIVVSHRAFVRMIGILMLTVVGGDADDPGISIMNPRVITVDGFIFMLKESIPILNRKAYAEQDIAMVASNTCQRLVQTIFDENGFETRLITRLEAVGNRIQDPNELADDEEIQSIRHEEKDAGEQALSRKLPPIVWTNIAVECKQVFDEEFDELWRKAEIAARNRIWANEREERLQAVRRALDERRERLAERAMRLQAEKERDIYKSVQWCFDNWITILASLFGIMAFTWIISKIVKCVGCWRTLCGKSKYPADSRKLVTKLNQVLDQNYQCTTCAARYESENVTVVNELEEKVSVLVGEDVEEKKDLVP